MRCITIIYEGWINNYRVIMKDSKVIHAVLYKILKIPQRIAINPKLTFLSGNIE